MSPTRMSRVESAIRVVLAYQQAFNRHDLVNMIQLLSDDCVFEEHRPAPDGAVYAGKGAITQFLQDLFGQSPQARMEIEDTFSAGQRCILRWRYHWLDGAGRARHVRGVDLFRVRDGLIHEKLSYAKVHDAATVEARAGSVALE